MFLYLSETAAHGQTVELTTDAPKRNLDKFPYIGDRNRTLMAGEHSVFGSTLEKPYTLRLGDIHETPRTVLP